MRKLVVGLLCVALSIGMISGCGGQQKAETKQQQDNSKSDDKIAELESKIAELESENESLQNVVTGNNMVSDNSTLPAGDIVPQQLTINTPFTCDGIFEMNITSAEWVDEILPSNTSDWYSYFEDVDGESFFVLRGTIKNISGDVIDIEHCSISEMVFNNTYRYSASWTAEGDGNDDFHGYQINPLKETNFVMYVSVPDEVKTNFKSCKTTFGFNNLANYAFDWDDCTHIYEITVQ